MTKERRRTNDGPPAARELIPRGSPRHDSWWDWFYALPPAKQERQLVFLEARELRARKQVWVKIASALFCLTVCLGVLAVIFWEGTLASAAFFTFILFLGASLQAEEPEEAREALKQLEQGDGGRLLQKPSPQVGTKRSSDQKEPPRRHS